MKGTVNEFPHGHGMRRCRYRVQEKAHIQHVLTAITVNIERLSGLPPTEETPTRRRPTAFQNYLDQRRSPDRGPGEPSAADLGNSKIPDGVDLKAVSNIDAAVLGHRRDGRGDFYRPHRGDSNRTAGRTGKHRVPAGYFWVTSVQ
ncbi:transposase [Streptomyces sp. G35A]